MFPQPPVSRFAFRSLSAAGWRTWFALSLSVGVAAAVPLPVRHDRSRRRECVHQFRVIPWRALFLVPAGAGFAGVPGAGTLGSSHDRGGDCVGSPSLPRLRCRPGRPARHVPTHRLCSSMSVLPYSCLSTPSWFVVRSFFDFGLFGSFLSSCACRPNFRGSATVLPCVEYGA